MPPKHETYTFNQIKEIIEKNEETIMKFVNSTIERLERKIDNLTEENRTLRAELKDVKSGMEFNDGTFSSKMKELDELKVKKKQKIAERNKQLEQKICEMEDRSRRNNLRFNGIQEETNDETWEESEKKIKKLLTKRLGLNEEDFEIERAHRTGNKFQRDGQKRTRTIIAKFLSYKQKVLILKAFKEKQLWKEKIFINEDFSEGTILKRKELFKQAKEHRKNGKFAKVIYNKLVVRTFRD